ncbi:PREDICTED: uncharacterized protein LOC107171020 [Diuraphis noxia]|uniref:uncharacterized protein LOC107171020 n=1 Tax=Diuraphis noxia TaxID=143948 RepID=UPI0007637B4A|nr:PREDICTED: uncharacterized protein LOC107171020 [Diuraphis noxia]
MLLLVWISIDIFQNILSDILAENCSDVSDDVTDNMCIDSNHNSESEQNVSESDKSETESNTDNDDDIRPSKFLYAVFKSNHENANTLFATDGTGREIFRLVMSKKRFLFLISCLRFDNSDTRTERKENDPLAPISEIFNEFIENCKLNYSLSSCVTVDEIHYLFNAYIYAGQNTDGITLDHTERKFSKPTQSVLRLSKPIQGTNPFLPKKKSTVGFTQYGFTKDLTLLSYEPKPNKAVLLISSMHNQKGFDNDVQKPEIISYYNSTKGGVDALDEKCSVYSAGRRTRRWPLAIFYRLLDISSVNSYVLYNSFKNNETMTRADYLKSLAFELVSPELERRFENTRISREIRSGIGRVLGKSKHLKDTPVYEDKLESRKTCRICPPRKKRKTIYQCKLCGDPICLECSRKICSNCFGN